MPWNDVVLIYISVYGERERGSWRPRRINLLDDGVELEAEPDLLVENICV